MSLADEMNLKTPKELLGEETALEQVEELNVSSLITFKNHPFKVIEDDSMEKLVESIQEFGIATPIIVRPQKFGKFEIVAGHRRTRACQILGLETIPAIIRDLDDDQAIFYMVDTNLQREEILPSEKAFAYKMKLEALNRRGQRTDLTYSPVGNKLEPGKPSVSIVAEESGESKNQIFRYIRLTFLIGDFLDLVDAKKLPLQTAVELSYLQESEQLRVGEVMDMQGMTPSFEQGNKLKKYSKEGTLTEALIESVLTEVKNKMQKVSIKVDTSKYFSVDTPKAEIEELIDSLLAKWKSTQVNQ